MITTALIKLERIHFNPDGFTRKKSVQGFKSYLAWRSRQGNPVFSEEMSGTLSQWCQQKKIYVQGKNERFKPSVYWFFGFIGLDLRAEWELLWSEAIWKEIKRRKVLHHPDRRPEDENIYKLLGQAERLLRSRKVYLDAHCRSEKPEWL